MTTRGSAAHPLRDSIADDWTVHSLEWTLARFTVHRNDNKPAYGPIGDSWMALGTFEKKESVGTWCNSPKPWPTMASRHKFDRGASGQ